MDFHALYERHAPDVRRFALFLSGDPALADDVTSETFVRAWVARDRIRLPTVRSYLLTVARNIYRDLMRGARRRPEVPLDDGVSDPSAGSPSARFEASAELRLVLQELQALEEIDRSALLMRALDEMPYADIAAALGVSVVAAKVKVHRARVKLMRARTSVDPPLSRGGKPS